MKTFATAVALISLVPTILGLTINTPTNVVQCQPIQFTWGDGTPPYFLSIIPGGQPAATALKTFPTQQGTSVTWNVDIAAGTGITISLKDSTGAQAYSDIVTILAGSDSSCLSSSTAVAGSSTPAGSSASGSAAATSGTATSSKAGSPSASSTKTPNAASRSSTGVYGFAGVMGLIGAALF